MPAAAPGNPLAEILAARILAQGPITFADYMDACLYHPEFGYYTRADVSPRRDYYTSVDVHPMFGSLLARQLQEMWVVMGRPQVFHLVEAGAGTGALARCILDFIAETFSDFYAALRYLAVEVSAARRREHAVALARHLASGRVESLGALPDAIPCGCIFSNELLDALPVRRVSFSGGALREIHVTYEGARFQEVELPLSTPVLGSYFSEQGITLQEEQQTEAGLAVCRWIREAGKRLGKGFVLTIDYGREARELYDERHMRGTLLAYQRHRASEDYYRAPGLQDLTAHVNFTAMDLWGKRAGLERVGLVSQGNFLMALARKSQFAELESAGGGEADAARRRLMFKTLIYPDGMGEAFQVFLQRKGIAEPALTGLEPL
jgi:SAM-dependent MidA family methyltransferase